MSSNSADNNKTLDAAFDRPAGVTANVFFSHDDNGLQTATDVTGMCAKSACQQAAADESNNEHDTACQQCSPRSSGIREATLSLSSQVAIHVDAFGASDNSF